MTCIIGLKHNNKIYMGTDSAITIGSNMLASTKTKILKNNNYLVGFAGPRAIFNLLSERESIFLGDFSNKHLNDIWRNLIDCTPINCESEIMIASKNNLYWMGNIASWRLINEDFECIGNAAPIAKGAMSMAQGLINDPRDKINKSLKIAEKYCNGVRSPFQIECIGEGHE